MQETQEIRVRSLGQEDSPGGGNGTPLQYSCLENPTDGGAWRITVHRVAKSQTQLATEHAWLCQWVSKPDFKSVSGLPHCGSGPNFTELLVWFGETRRVETTVLKVRKTPSV